MIPILMYHQVVDISKDADPVGLAVRPSQFERQMSYLYKHGYRCLALSDALRYFQKQQDPPKKTFVITFDDGYQDISLNAHPILQKYGFTATIFLVTGRMGELTNWWGQTGKSSAKLLSWSEARELARHGYTLASHTHSHPFLTSLQDEDVQKEIYDSKKAIQDNLGITVDYFSYPFSVTDSRIEHLVRLAGYKAACAGDSGARGLFHLWRIPIQRNETQFTFRLKVSGWYDRRTHLRESPSGLFVRRIFRTGKKVLKIQVPGKPREWNRETHPR